MSLLPNPRPGPEAGEAAVFLPDRAGRQRR